MLSNPAAVPLHRPDARKPHVQVHAQGESPHKVYEVVMLADLVQAGGARCGRVQGGTPWQPRHEEEQGGAPRGGGSRPLQWKMFSGKSTYLVMAGSRSFAILLLKDVPKMAVPGAGSGT